MKTEERQSGIGREDKKATGCPEGPESLSRVTGMLKMAATYKRKIMLGSFLYNSDNLCYLCLVPITD